MRARLLAAVAVAALCTGAAAQTPRLVVPADGAVTRGTAPGIEIVGLPRGDTATLVALRRMARPAAQGRSDTLVLRSAGSFAGPRGGRVRVDHTAPIAGTWAGADPLGLFWSMERRDTALALPPGRVALRLEWRGRVVDSATVALRSAVPGTRGGWVAGDGFAGAFARPAGPGPHPALLLLHGSEGGDSATARTLAEAFAAHGFAALAVTYFAWGGRYPGVPGALVNVPVETLDRARAWMGAQPGVDTTRTGLWGGSKGAELALVAAARRPWVRAVAACVPSDAVWTGFGRTRVPGEAFSSWSDGGVPLPSIPYDRYEDVLAGRATARAVHDRSRAGAPDSVARALIPVGRTRARLLLLGSDRDEVWASGPMARAIAASMRAAGHGARVEIITFPTAGHGICGTGTTPALAPEPASPDAPSPRATARAAARSWQATVRFLKETLR